MTLYQIDVETPVGALAVTASDEAVVGLRLPGAFGPHLDAVPGTGRPLLEEARRELEAYFEGTLRAFDLPLAPAGTEFQRAVWGKLLEIPFGETRSYGEIARSLGRERAFRAVGAANGRNPIAVLIPCHRVIGSDGSLTGFGGGEEMKRFLLDHERRAAGALRSRQAELFR